MTTPKGMRKDWRDRIDEWFITGQDTKTQVLTELVMEDFTATAAARIGEYIAWLDMRVAELEDTVESWEDEDAGDEAETGQGNGDST